MLSHFPEPVLQAIVEEVATDLGYESSSNAESVLDDNLSEDDNQTSFSDEDTDAYGETDNSDEDMINIDAHSDEEVDLLEGDYGRNDLVQPDSPRGLADTISPHERAQAVIRFFRWLVDESLEHRIGAEETMRGLNEITIALRPIMADQRNRLSIGQWTAFNNAYLTQLLRLQLGHVRDPLF